MSTYIPEENEDLIVWAENFKKTFPEFARANAFPEQHIEVALKASDRLIAMCNESMKLDRQGKNNQALEIQKTEFAMALACLYNKK